MSEDRNRNSGSLLDPFLATGGVIPYGAGLGVLTANPAAEGRYVVYYGSDGKPVKISPLVLEAIKNAGMPLVEVPRQATQLVPGEFGYAPNPTHLRGNSATVDAANEVRARLGKWVSNVRMGLTGPGLGVNLQPFPNGQGNLQVDLDSRAMDTVVGQHRLHR